MPDAANQRGSARSSKFPEVINQRGGLRLHLYRPDSRARGLVLLAPGSRGGMGPGQIESTRGIFSPTIRSTYGSLAPRLATEQGFAVCHFTWRRPPTRAGQGRGTLKAPSTLREGVDDIAAAVAFLRGQYGATLPLVLVGFSFGGPSSMAAAALSLTDPARSLGPLAGIVTLGTGLRTAPGGSLVQVGRSLRGGASRSEPHDYGGADSEACVDAYAAEGLPLLMAHGLEDVTVDPRASGCIFERAAGPKGAAWLRGADHQMEARFDALLALLLEWIPALLSAARPDAPRADAADAHDAVAADAHPLAGLTGWGTPCVL